MCNRLEGVWLPHIFGGEPHPFWQIIHPYLRLHLRDQNSFKGHKINPQVALLVIMIITVID